MSDLVRMIRDIQREVGTDDDGIFGPVTAGLVLAELRHRVADFEDEKETPARVAEHCTLDARSEGIIATLDVKAQPMFRKFLCLAKATAATLGCDYVLISGNRTFAEQDALYALGRTKPGTIATKARGGYSNHNFGIAADAGVFQGKVYLDGGTKEQKALAAKVHKACAQHAEACGLDWGGTWSGFTDLPHYEVRTGLSLTAKRKAMNEKGSVLA